MCPNMRQDVSQAREEVSVTETAVCKAPWWRPFMVHYMILPMDELWPGEVEGCWGAMHLPTWAESTVIPQIL